MAVLNAKCVDVKAWAEKQNLGILTMKIGDANKEYTSNRIRHWDKVASLYKTRFSLGGGYHRRLAQIYRNLIPPGSSVLEIGCGTGDLLASARFRCSFLVRFADNFFQNGKLLIRKPRQCLHVTILLNSWCHVSSFILAKYRTSFSIHYYSATSIITLTENENYHPYNQP
jgi:SAM-dependent methyltransferase